MAEYCAITAPEENCGPSADGDFCIFHKPDKGEAEADEFDRAFLEEYARKRKPSEETDSGERLVFEEIIGYQYVFPEGTDIPLRNARFAGMVSFNAATFNGISFRGATFEDHVSFQGVDFRDYADFFGADFRGTENLDVRGTEIAKATDFAEATFMGSATFSRGTFEGDASFESVSFLNGAAFWGCEFTFVSFREASFGDEADFRNTRFGDARFGNVDFEGEALFELDDSLDGHSEFGGRCNFEGAVFRKACSFEGTVFKDEISFRNAIFRQGLDFESEEEDPDQKYRLPSANIEATRIQRVEFENRGRKKEADRLFVREMRTYRSISKTDSLKSKIKACAEWLLADLTCEYGTNGGRLILVSGGVMVFFAFLYGIGDLVQSPWIGTVTVQADGAPVPSPYIYAYYSVVTFTTLGYGDVSPSGIVMTIASSIEALLGAVLLALLVAVFARQYLR